MYDLLYFFLFRIRLIEAQKFYQNKSYFIYLIIHFIFIGFKSINFILNIFLVVLFYFPINF
jgi:hypothetical protein